MAVTPEVDFSGLTVLVLGDVMLDTWIYGQIERISPEAPVPVLRTERRSEMLGGAGNVARNICALGGRAILASVIGDDACGDQLRQLAEGHSSTPGSLDLRLVVSPQRSTVHKTRYVAAGQQVLRVDEETVLPIEGSVAAQLVARFEQALAEADIVILSDYAKGVLTDTVLRLAIATATALGKPVVADPKGRDFSRYSGVSVLTPNRLETLVATGVDCTDDFRAEEAGRLVLTATNCDAVLITRGADGVSIVMRHSPATHVAGQARSVFDVSGAGDTVVATLALSIAYGHSLAEAARLANCAAGIVVEKAGTATVGARELSEALHDPGHDADGAKILPLERVLEHVARWRAAGQRIGFTNGCFDLLHPGHVALLTNARAACDKLVVGLNSDASVKRLKGTDRPLQNELARAKVMASLGAVDLVVFFEEDTPMDLIEALRPDLLAKGADYAEEDVVGAAFVHSYGGNVYLVPLEQGHSTTAIASRLKNATTRPRGQTRFSSATNQ